jgi:hypothetical protein
MGKLPSPRGHLIVRELSGELVVYDKARHRAFCLNPAVASIWKSCEERTSAGQARRRLQDELGRPVPEVLVTFGVDQLRKAGLLQEAAASAPAPPSRREVLRAIGVVGATLLPMVASLAVPPAVAAASCGSCNAKTGTNACNNAHCSVGAVCGKTCTKHCQPSGNCG